MIVRFFAPAEHDGPRIAYSHEDWGADALPREGETVLLNGTCWKVRTVVHQFQTADRSRPTNSVDVYLIEPDVEFAEAVRDLARVRA